MPGEADGDGPRGQLPPFTPPRFNWNQDNLYEQFKNFKRVVKFAFKGQCEKCSDSIKCGSIFNWLGVEAYPTYDNLSINEDDKKDPSKLLDAFERYFKPDRNVLQSWYALGSICHVRPKRPPFPVNLRDWIPSDSRERRQHAQTGVLHSSIHRLIGTHPLVVCRPPVDKE